MTQQTTPKLTPYQMVTRSSWPDFQHKLDYLAIKNGYADHTRYIHPSGLTCEIKNFAEAAVYLSAFKGLIVFDASPNDDMSGIEGKPYADAFTGQTADGQTLKAGLTVFTPNGWYKAPEHSDYAALFKAAYPEAGGLTTISKNMSSRKRYALFQQHSETLQLTDLRPSLARRQHPALYEEQEKVLVQMQKTAGFHLLSGEVGVGKTHIAAEYVNSLLQKQPESRVLIIEPVPEVANKFKQLIHQSIAGHVQIMDDVAALGSQQKQDLVVFDEFHKYDKNKRVANFPLKTAPSHYPDNVIAMTGTVSSQYPEQIWSVAHNYAAVDKMRHPVSEIAAFSYGPYNAKHVPQMSSIRTLPEHFLSSVLKGNLVQLLRRDVKELGLAEQMPVNKVSVGIKLSPEDKLFYHLLKVRAKSLHMSEPDQLKILDEAFNTNKSEFVVQPVYDYQGKKRPASRRYQLVDPKRVPAGTTNLYYLGRHDGAFQDKKLDVIRGIAQKASGKTLVYLTNGSYGPRVTQGLEAAGVQAEFVDTQKSGAVQKINQSTAKAVVFDVSPIAEGVDLKADTVVWYNTPVSSGLDEQACGRITRLNSSKHEKNFYYLYHETTIQQQLTENIVRTNEVNNVALNRTGVKSVDVAASKLLLQ